METEMIAMQIIASAGDGKALAFDALECAKKGEFQEAIKLIEESEKASIEAHKAQTELLVNEANGEKTEVDVLLVHSQDHLMTSILAQELIKEMIVMYEQMDDIKKQIGVK